MSRLDFDFCVAASHPSLAGHFPGRPVVPGVLLLDHVLDALQRATGQTVAALPHVKFTSALSPDEQAHGYCELDGARASFRVSALRGGEVMPVAQGMAILSPGPAT